MTRTNRIKITALALLFFSPFAWTIGQAAATWDSVGETEGAPPRDRVFERALELLERRTALRGGKPCPSRLPDRLGYNHLVSPASLRLDFVAVLDSADFLIAGPTPMPGRPDCYEFYYFYPFDN